MLHTNLRIQTPPVATVRPATAQIPVQADPRAWALAMAQGVALCRL